MNIEIINTGSELMLGRVLNTHQQWLCRQLTDRGYSVGRSVGVADTAGAITDAVRDALRNAQVILTTGGLGPTSDDLTREAIAAMLGLALHEDATVRAHIEGWFAARQRTAPPGTRIQAMVPEGAQVLHNAHGTAPGLVLEMSGSSPEAGRAWLVMLPGPPRELRPMFLDQVLPWLTRTFPLPAAFACRTLRSTGIGESMVQARIAPPLAPLVARGLEVGYCSRPGEVDIRLAATGSDADELVAAAEPMVQEQLGNHIFSREDDPLERVVVQLLAAKRRQLVVAESCTGGLLSNRITNVPGASEIFRGGLVTYSDALKQELLGVRAETLAGHGAVSEATAREMAEGARRRYGADVALAITGIAGPGGGTDTKPTGTVFIALATPDGTTVRQQLNRFERETFKSVTSQQALEMLRQELLR